mgnify:CR=1 FL=1
MVTISWSEIVMKVFSLKQMEDTLWTGLTDSYVKLPMAITAENLAEKYNLTREECDKYAVLTQQRWGKGKFSSCKFKFIRV